MLFYSCFIISIFYLCSNSFLPRVLFHSLLRVDVATVVVVVATAVVTLVVVVATAIVIVATLTIN